MNDFKQRLRDQLDEANRIMAANLAKSLYGDETPLSRLLAQPKQKGPLWARLWLSAQSKLGRILLAAANALGEYNDWD